MNQAQYEQIKLLPKIDLHVHLDGSVKPDTIRDLAKSQGKALPVASENDDLTPWMQIDESCTSLVEYLSKFNFVLPFMQTAESLERIAEEIVEQAAASNCLYVEVRFAPILHTLEGLSASDAIKHTIAGLRRGEQMFDVKARVIVICMRHDSIENNLEVIDAARDYYGKGVAAVDLAGDEAGFPPGLHREVFERASKYNLPITIHAGEAGGSNNVREAITELGAARIGHGVRITEDPSVMELVKSTRTPLEMCPVSNIQTKAVSGWDTYPIRRFMEEGILVTVNTDNMTVSGTTMNLEFEMLAEHCGFTLEELAQLTRNSAEAAFLSEEEKSELREAVQQALQKLGL
ncbi:adenosine deaminase [Paenibacillus glycanilyticus]|uniref:Adenosine deaminase n=1 Tax=Paenibacillus glycanilyticus TaxID=126569 RepID=A0ABQ6GKG9_9BACL|nr:adenosine deaminase [Paenibacillus glycanilyticus]GLX70730.1 adenosine deaminase [Paenibacillus glycanilyticus]